MLPPYGAPVGLKVLVAGWTSVRIAWRPPIGASPLPPYYLVYIYKGTTCNRDTLVATYPRIAHTTTPPQFGGLVRHTRYTVHVVASGPNGTRVKPNTYASATFVTA